MKPSVLCIDDEPDITEAVRLNLINEDLDLDTFNDPEEGLKAAMKKEYTVALVDIRMPGMSGVEVMSSLKKASPRTMRINMSSHADLETVLEALSKNNVYDFIKKPLKRDKFLAVIRKAIKMFKLQQERDELSESLKQKNALLEDWNQRLDQEVKKKTLELSIRDKLMQNLSGCGESSQNSYDLIKEFFNSFFPKAQFKLYILREDELHLHTNFDSESQVWSKKVSAKAFELLGIVDREKLSAFTQQSDQNCGYVMQLERHQRRLGLIVVSQSDVCEVSQIRSLERFVNLVSLVVYDELASERLSEESLTSLLREE